MAKKIKTNSNNINKTLLKANYFEDGGKVTLEGVAGATGTLGSLVTNAINQAKITDPSSLKKSMIASGTTPIGASDYNALSSMWIGNNEWRDYNYRDFRDKSLGDDILNGVSAGLQGSSAGLSAGGAIGAIIGGVVGTGSSIIGSAIGRHKARKTAREVNALGDQMNASRINNFLANAENIAYSNNSNVLRNSFKEGGFLDSYINPTSTAGASAKLAFQLIDPTGISSWPDVANSASLFWEDPSWSRGGNLLLEAVGALPIIGKIGKGVKIANKLRKGKRGVDSAGLINTADKVSTVNSKIDNIPEAIPITRPIARGTQDLTTRYLSNPLYRRADELWGVSPNNAEGIINIINAANTSADVISGVSSINNTLEKDPKSSTEEIIKKIEENVGDIIEPPRREKELKRHRPYAKFTSIDPELIPMMALEEELELMPNKPLKRPFLPEEEFIPLDAGKEIKLNKSMKNKNIYKTGGPLESPDGFTDINAGGTHEQNPRGGVPVGYGENGLMNLLEEGEVIAKEPSYRESRAPEYVFNNNSYIDSTTKKKLGIKRIKNLTYAEALKEIRREADERPNDPISRDTLNKKMEYLKRAQERDNAMRAMQQQQAQGVNKYALGDEFYRLSSYKTPQLEIPKVSYSSNIPNVWNRASLDAPPVEPPRYYLTDKVRGVDLPPINEGLNLSYMGPDKITVGGGKVKKFMPDDENGSALSYLQYAPLLGGAISLASALRKPDYKYANQLLSAAKDSLHNVGSMRPLLYADYMQMRPTDRNYYSNKLAAQAGATRRSILNSMNANPYASGVHLLAADNNILSQQGDLLFKGDKENWERYKDVSSYRQDTNKVRSSLMADYDKMNLAAKTQNNASYLNAIAQGLAMKAAVDANRVNAINSGATTLLTELGELGRQFADRNAINSLNSLYYYIDDRNNIRYKRAFYELTPSEQIQIRKEAMDNIKLNNGIKENKKENG